MRPYLEYLPILLMGLPWIMEHGLRKWKVGLSCLVLLLAYVNVIQSYQFHQNIMLWDGMNEESYRGIFLSTDRELVGYYYNFPEKWKYVGLDSAVHRIVRPYFQSNVGFPLGTEDGARSRCSPSEKAKYPNESIFGARAERPVQQTNFLGSTSHCTSNDRSWME